MFQAKRLISVVIQNPVWNFVTSKIKNYSFHSSVCTVCLRNWQLSHKTSLSVKTNRMYELQQFQQNGHHSYWMMLHWVWTLTDMKETRAVLKQKSNKIGTIQLLLLTITTIWALLLIFIVSIQTIPSSCNKAQNSRPMHTLSLIQLLSQQLLTNYYS